MDSADRPSGVGFKGAAADPNVMVTDVREQSGRHSKHWTLERRDKRRETDERLTAKTGNGGPETGYFCKTEHQTRNHNNGWNRPHFEGRHPMSGDSA